MHKNFKIQDSNYANTKFIFCFEHGDDILQNIFDIV